MKVTQQKPEEKTVKATLLKNAKVGEIIRFANVSFEDALKEDLFYFVMSSKDKRVKLLNLANAEQIERDDVWEVHVHSANISIVK
jgi:hypothetical protein